MTFDYMIGGLQLTRHFSSIQEYDDALLELAACTCDDCGATGESLSRIHELGHFWVCDTCYDKINAMIDAADDGDAQAAALLAARKPVAMETQYAEPAAAGRMLAVVAGDDCPF